MTEAAPRRRNAQRTREAIIEAAREKFRTRAYEQVSLRDVAAAAGINAALVIRYFGSKEGLFEAVLQSQVRGPEADLAGGCAGLGLRLADGHLARAHDAADYQAINTAIWSAASPAAAGIVARDVEARFVRAIAEQLAGEDAEIRAALIVAVLMGSTIMRNMLKVDALSAAEPERLSAWMAGALQHLVDGD